MYLALEKLIVTSWMLKEEIKIYLFHVCLQLISYRIYLAIYTFPQTRSIYNYVENVKKKRNLTDLKFINCPIATIVNS